MPKKFPARKRAATKSRSGNPKKARSESTEGRADKEEQNGGTKDVIGDAHLPTPGPEFDSVRSARKQVEELFLTQMTPPIDVDSIVVTSAYDSQFLGERSKLRPAYKPSLGVNDEDILRTLDLINGKSKPNEKVATVGIQVLNWLGYRVVADDKPAAYLLEWMSSDPHVVDIASRWLLLGAASHCCELLFHVRRVRAMGFGKVPTVGDEDPRLFDRRLCKSFVLPLQYDSGRREWDIFESLLGRSIHRIGLSPFPEAVLPDAGDQIMKMGGGSEYLKNLDGRVFTESDAWDLIMVRLRESIENRIAEVERNLINAIVGREVPGGWEPDHRNEYPCFPPMIPKYLAIHIQDSLKSYQKLSSDHRKTAFWVAHACREIRNVKSTFDALGLKLPSGFSIAPSNLNEAESVLRAAVLLAEPKWSRPRSPSDWIRILKKLGEEISADTFSRRRKGATPLYRQNPNSTTKFVSLAIEDLPPNYTDEVTP